ncbi:hypothetical protein ANCDUO_25611 [Ancylostoma duodenale]|uniref:Uncharacterized protein n=1 Tax=Ancylostoma duodenale TaxID=51022 RepID=A0A0C2FCE8_9BILA|nr:hypothetical protein ANCDUO_25611 [Ancylostoma duodenale]
MWANSLTAEKEPAWQKAYLDYMFRLLDASGKRPAGRPLRNPAGGQFNSIDYKRFLSLWQQYFRSTDINDVGNHLLGTP